MLTVSVNSVISVWLKHAAKKSVLSVRSVSHNKIRIVLPYSTYYVNKYHLCSPACQALAPGSRHTHYGINSFAYLCCFGPTFLSARKDFAKLSVPEGKLLYLHKHKYLLVKFLVNRLTCQLVY